MKRSRKQKLTVWLLLFCLLVSLSPVAVSPPADAQAAGNWTGNLKLEAVAGDHRIYFDEDRNLVVQGEYYTQSKATLSYHTSVLYFTKEITNGNPGAMELYYPVNVSSHPSEAADKPNYVYDTYIVPRGQLEEVVRYLYGEDGLNEPRKVYVSEGFILKCRNNPSEEWRLLEGKTYSSLSDIRSAANWSETTYKNFKKYYDTEITLSLTRYNLTVETDDNDGGITKGSGRYFSGDSVPVRAVPNEGYTFKEWKVQGGSPSGFDKTEADAVFTMPSSDVTLIAVFEKEKIPEPTKEPVATPKPGDPTPTPMPTPTLAPTPTPPLPEPGEAYGQNIRYYGTDKGYTMKGIYEQDGPLAGISSAENSRIRSDEYTALDAYYSVGRDSSGNTWYFIPDGTDATFVHPAVYQGKDASSPQVKDIRELVFPETIIYSGKTYTVTSIGGGTDKYHSSKEQHNSSGITSTGYTLGKTSGSCYYNQSVSSTSGTRETCQSINTHTGYCYGVIGNGEITSSGSVHFDFFQDGEYSYHYCDYESSYYVYNTTLEFVTIPDTVTEICDYAFYQCQGLRKITGAEGVKEIGKYAFAGASVLTTAPSVEVSGNYRRYHYNESYSTGIPTDTMRSWQSAVALREYMEPAGFPVLDTIGTYAFAYRKNLFDVKLPDCVAVIKDDAFKACDLNSITIPGKNTAMEGNSGKMAGRDTLGTKGNPDTMIITVPESKAMYYGLTYEDYYTLRCGYPVTYDKNALPAEEYTTAAMLEVLKREIKESVSGNITSYGSSGSTSISGSYEAVLDTQGTLWLKKGGALFPSEVMRGTKFTELRKVTLSEKGSYNEKRADYCFAAAENGKVYFYDPAGVWKDTGIPAESLGHRWVCSTVKDSSSEESSSGYSSWNSSSVKIYYLYYLDGNGVPSRKEMYRSTTGSYGGSSYDGTSYSTSYSFRTGNTAEKLPVPEGVAFRSLYAVDIREGSTGTSASWGDSYSNNRKEYSLYLPDVYAEDTEGNLWHASGGNPGQKTSYSSYTGETETTPGYLDAERTNQALPVSYYTWERADGIRQVFGEFEESATSYLHVLDAAGNLLLKGGKEYSVLSGKNFVSAETVTGNYALLTGADGSTWVYLYRNVPSRYGIPQHKPVKLPDGVRVTAQWESHNSYYGKTGYWDNDTYYHHYSLFLSDDSGRLWVVKETGMTRYDASAGQPYTSWTSSGPVCLLSGTEKVYVPEDTEYGAVLIMDKNGGLWQYADGKTGGEYLHYYYPDGRLEKITGEKETAAALAKFSASMYSTGYEFVETLYADMFTRPGYRFLSWNTAADGSGISLQPGGRLPVTAPVTIYAQWERTKNIIRYAPNGGSGIMEDDAYEPDVTTAVLKKNSYVKTGCEFTGWNIKADGSGTSYAGGASVTIPAGTTVLYAQWKPFPYVVKVAEDEVRVTPVRVTDTIELDYDEEMTIPAALPDKVYTVTYDLNPETGRTPYWKTEDPDADRYTKARLSFGGWQLYEETENGCHYLGLYKPGTVVKNLAETKDAVLYLFPYWGGEASYVDLPPAGCKGYDFIGWTTVKNDRTDILYASEGSHARYKPKGNETLYAYWEPAISYVILNDRGATGTDHTRGVLVTYGKPVPDIIVPEKEGFTFRGYFTEIRGKGTKYYDENGRLLVTKEEMWEDAPAELYACWEQNPPEYPEAGPSPAVTAKPAEAPVDIVIEKTPYAEITVSGYDAETAVPSTETAEVTLCAGKYAFSGVISNVTGVKDITIHVKIPYTIRYEDEETEELIDSEVRYAEYDITVPRAYSYWKTDRADIRKPLSGTITSGVFAGTPEIPFTITEDDFYTIKTYTDAEHVADPGISLTGEPVHIRGMENGKNISEDRIKEIVSAYAKNLAYTDTTPPDVKSDLLIFAGKTILPDTTGRSGAAPDKAEREAAETAIPWVQSSVSAAFNGEAGNGVYENMEDTDRPIETELTELLYSPLSGRTGTAAVTGFAVNRVTIHTPVVSNPKNALYQDEDEDSVTIDEYTEFLHMNLSKLMYGTHISAEGYGEGDYKTTVSGRTPFDCIVVKAGVPLYFDISGDTGTDSAGRPVNTEDDIRFEKDSAIRFVFEDGIWYLAEKKENPERTEKYPVDIADIRVYVLATECTSDFDVAYGVLAINGRAVLNYFNGNYGSLFRNKWAQETANTAPGCYFACNTVSCDVRYRYITFRWYDTEESVAQVSPDGFSVATKQGYEAYFYVTQPEGFEGMMEIVPKFSLTDTDGNLISDDILVIYSDYREGYLGDMRRFDGMTPADDTVTKTFRTNWLKVDGPAGSEVSQTWTFNGVLMNSASTAVRTVNGTEMDARHGAYRLPNGIHVLKVSDIPDTAISTAEEFISDWKVRDVIMQSDTVLPFAAAGYLKVELDVSVINADGTVLAGHGSLPAISLYYTIGDTGEGLYYRHNGILPEGDGMDDDVEADYVHTRRLR